MRLLALAGDPWTLMKSATWWQVMEYLRATRPIEESEPVAHLNPMALARYGVGVTVRDRTLTD